MQHLKQKADSCGHDSRQRSAIVMEHRVGSGAFSINVMRKRTSGSSVVGPSGVRRDFSVAQAATEGKVTGRPPDQQHGV